MARDNLSFHERSVSRNPVSIISIPFEYGSDARGLAKAPQYLLECGLERMLSVIGAPIAEKEIIACPKNLAPTLQFPKYLQETASVARAVCTSVAARRKKRETVISLCGDHASAIGSIAGAASVGEHIGVIYIDAHPDIHTHETTISGNTHAMVASASMGLGHPLLSEVGGRRVKVQPNNFLFMGIKDFDLQEPALVRQSGAHAVTMLDIATNGLSPALKAIDALSKQVDAVWISMDMDSIDKRYSPGVAMPCTDGFTRREIISIAHHIGVTCNVAGFDLVEMLPANDIDNKTAVLGLEISARFLGAEYTWYRSYMAPYEAKRKPKSTVQKSLRKVTHGRVRAKSR